MRKVSVEIYGSYDGPQITSPAPSISRLVKSALLFPFELIILGLLKALAAVASSLQNRVQPPKKTPKQLLFDKQLASYSLAWQQHIAKNHELMQDILIKLNRPVLTTKKKEDFDLKIASWENWIRDFLNTSSTATPELAKECTERLRKAKGQLALFKKDEARGGWVCPDSQKI